MFEFFWLEIVTAACAAPLVLHAIRAELVAKFCTRYGVPPGMSYHVMVFHPRYWHIWTTGQWSRYVARKTRQSPRRDSDATS